MVEAEKLSRWSRICRIYLLVLAGLLFVRTCAVGRVEAGEVGVRYNNALGLHKSDLRPGFHLEITGLQRIHRLPSYYLQVDYSGSDRFSVRTKDNNTIQLDVSIPYRIKPGEAFKIMDAGNHLA